MSGDKKVFQYIQFKSVVAPDFWYKLAEVKIDVEKLGEGRKKINGVCKYGINLHLFTRSSILSSDLLQFQR